MDSRTLRIRAHPVVPGRCTVRVIERRVAQQEQIRTWEKSQSNYGRRRCGAEFEESKRAFEIFEAMTLDPETGPHPPNTVSSDIFTRVAELMIIGPRKWGSTIELERIMRVSSMNDIRLCGSKPEADGADVEDTVLCSVCIDAPADRIFRACGHQCVCHSCARKQRTAASKRKRSGRKGRIAMSCPICRAETQIVPVAQYEGEVFS